MSKKNIHKTRNVRETLDEFKKHAEPQSSFYRKLVKDLIDDNLLTQDQLSSIILRKSGEKAFLDLWRQHDRYNLDTESLGSEKDWEFKSPDLERSYVENILKQVDQIMELTPKKFHKIKDMIFLILNEKISIERASSLTKQQVISLCYLQDEIVRGKVSIDDFLEWIRNKPKHPKNFIFSVSNLIRSNMDLKQIDTLPSWIHSELIEYPDLIEELVNSNLISEIKDEQLNNLKAIGGIDWKILPISKALTLTTEEIDKIATLKEYINEKEILVETALTIDPETFSKLKKLVDHPRCCRPAEFKELMQLLKNDENDVDQVKKLWPFIPHRMSLAEALRHPVSTEEYRIIQENQYAFCNAKLPFRDAISIGKRLTTERMRQASAELFPQLGILSEDEIVEISKSLASTENSSLSLCREIVDLVKLGYMVNFIEILKLGWYEERIIEEIMTVIMPNYLNKLLELLTPWIDKENVRHLILEYLDFTPPQQSSSHTSQIPKLQLLAGNVTALFVHSKQEILASLQVRMDEHLHQPRA